MAMAGATAYAADAPAAEPVVKTYQAIILVGTPVIIMVIKTLIPKIPKMWLPIMAPIVGAVIDLAFNLNFGTHTLIGMVLGAGGTGFREIADQMWKASKPPGPVTTTKPPIVSLLMLGLIAAFSSGCVAIKQRMNVVSVTESVVGIDISQRAEGEMPHLRLGFVRTQFHVVPTVRQSNEWMHTPNVVSSIAVETSQNTGIWEDFATGEATKWLLQDGYETNNASPTVAKVRAAAGTNKVITIEKKTK